LSTAVAGNRRRAPIGLIIVICERFRVWLDDLIQPTQVVGEQVREHFLQTEGVFPAPLAESSGQTLCRIRRLIPLLGLSGRFRVAIGEAIASIPHVARSAEL